MVHTLGMSWNQLTDTFHFSTATLSQQPVTKRKTLSTIAKLYDPLGLLAPVIISAKLFIQDLWSLKLDWENQLPPHLTAKWSEFIDQLPDINALSFPRWLGITSTGSLAIQGFCDVSQYALAAAVYIRSEEPDGTTKTALICAKTKVAPIKRLIISRLELSAAVLGSKLVNHVIQVLNLGKISTHIWTDSAITHTWINNHPSHWKDFIHNKVCYIQETLPSAKWHFISGKENPTDFATRGFIPSQLSESSSWWTGPEWLQHSSETWPSRFAVPEITENLEERPVSTNISIPQTSVSSFIWKCVTCVRYRKTRGSQLMGQLPTNRVTPSRPFLHSGVDYAGPLLVKTWKRRAARTYKAYIALFIYQAISAIHLELVTDYSADAFIAAYKSFTARKGICATLRSDCGTTLTGADTELRSLFLSFAKQLGELLPLLANDGTQWLE